MSCLLVLCLVVAHELPASGSSEVCGCAEAMAVDGRCAKCHVGYFALVRIDSLPLYQALDSHGHDIDAERTRCRVCRTLISAGGYCDDCHMGYVAGKGYFGRIGYHMAKGRTGNADATRKPCCPADGAWCATCHRGWVGNREFKDEADFTSARRFMTILHAAVEKSARCEHCAMAMIADSRCHACRVEFKDGQPVAGSTTARANR